MSGIALVTGAGSGIGRACAVALAAAGWQVALAGRRSGPLEETAALTGTEALVCPADVTDAGAVEALFGRIVAHFGRLDLLFNNAGASLPSTRIDRITPDDWNRIIAVNLTGAFLCLRAAFAQMAAQSPQGGRIINNGSLAAFVPRPHAAAYTASKHAITGLTKSAALDGRALNIACGQLDIGNAATDMAAGSSAGALQANGQIMSEPLMDVAEVARALVHMASMPLSANVQSMTVMATAMPFVGRG